MLPLVVTSLICERDEQEMSMMIDDFYEQEYDTYSSSNIQQLVVLLPTPT